MTKIKLNMKPFSVVAKSIRNNDVVVTMQGDKKESLSHPNTILVWGTDKDKERLQSILN